MTLILCRVQFLFVLLNLGKFVTANPSIPTGDSAIAEDQQDSPDVRSKDPEMPLDAAAAEDSLESPDAHSKDAEILLGKAGITGSLDSSDVHSEDTEILQMEAATEDSLDSSDVHSKDPDNLLGEAATEDSLDSPNVHSKDLENFANDSAPENLMIDMVDDVVHDVVNDVTSLSFLAPDKGDAVPPFPVTFPGCSCEWNEPGYSCENDILTPDSMAGQPCCCCGLKCLRDHRCSNDQCSMLGYNQQKEMEDEEKRIAELLNRSDVVLPGNIPGFTVDLGKGQCTNKKILAKCAELGLIPVCDHSSYARNAKVCWTNMQPSHWSQFNGRYRMKSNGFPIGEEFDEKSMGMCFMANYPHPWALAPTGYSHVWTNSAGQISPLTPGTQAHQYKGPQTPSKAVRISQMNDCSSELGCWRTLCVKKDPCSDCKSCGNPCGPCGRSNCPPSPPPELMCKNGKQMSKKYTGKWPHCSNIGCFSGKSFNQVELECLNNPRCNGFSFTHRAGDGAPNSGGGCLKQSCIPERNGYGVKSHDYWATGACQVSKPTTKPTVATTKPIVTTTTQTVTKWYLGDRGLSCTQVCSKKGQLCVDNIDWSKEKENQVIVAKKAGARCRSWGVNNNPYNPSIFANWAHNIRYGHAGKCLKTGTRKTQCKYPGGSGIQRICACRSKGTAPTTTGGTAPTTTTTTTTTTKPYVTTTTLHAKWYLGDRGLTCTKVCSKKGQLCVDNIDWSKEKELQPAVAKKAGARCRGWGFFNKPYNPSIYANIITNHGRISKCIATQSRNTQCNAYAGTRLKRICACRSR